jgi:tetratricopeptide (TPR) repeat protein
MIKAVLISLLSVVYSATVLTPLQAQNIAALMQQAQAFEKAFKDDEALKKYVEVLKHDPLHIDALCKTSELYNIIGKRLASKEEQKKYYKTGEAYARKAIKVNPNHSEANFAMAISMGRIALISSGKEKVAAVKEIKTYADKCIQLDPKNFKGYHVLGKWHYEVSDLNSFERWIVKITYGALPPSSLDESIKNYEKSKQLHPGFLLNYLELAKAYKRKGETNKARTLLEQMQKLPASASDDVKIKRLGKELLDDL